MTAQNLKKHTYEIITPDGGKITRTTTRRYTHAALYWMHGEYRATNWFGRGELAAAFAQKHPNAIIVPVSNPRPEDAPSPPAVPTPNDDPPPAPTSASAIAALRAEYERAEQIVLDLTPEDAADASAMQAWRDARRAAWCARKALDAALRAHQLDPAQHHERENLREVRRDVREERAGHDAAHIDRENYGVSNADFLR